MAARTDLARRPLAFRELIPTADGELYFANKNYVFGNRSRDRFLINHVTDSLRVYNPTRAQCEGIFENLFKHIIQHLKVRDQEGGRDEFWQCVTTSWRESSGVSPILVPGDVRNIALGITRAERNYAGPKTPNPSPFLHYVRETNRHFKQFESESDEAVEALEEIELRGEGGSSFEAPRPQQRRIPWQEPGDDGRLHVPPQPQPAVLHHVQVQTQSRSALRHAKRKQKRREEAKKAEEKRREEAEKAEEHRQKEQERVEEGKKRAEAVWQKIVAGGATAEEVTPPNQHQNWTLALRPAPVKATAEEVTPPNQHRNLTLALRPAPGMKRRATDEAEDVPNSKRFATLPIRGPRPQLQSSISTLCGTAAVSAVAVSTAAPTAVFTLASGPPTVPAASITSPHGLGQRSILSILSWQPEPVPTKGNDKGEEVEEDIENVIV